MSKRTKSVRPEPGLVPGNDEEQFVRAWQSLWAETKDRPWLLHLLATEGNRLLEGFVAAYRHLLALSRQQRRAILRRAGMGLAGVALLLSLNGSAALALPTPPTGNAQVNGGAICDLIDAINAANSDSAVGACDAGSGADTITLLNNVTLTAVDNTGSNGSNGLPIITSPITIDGNNFTISRDGSAPSFRFFEIASTGDLTLNQTTLSGGDAAYEGIGNLRGFGGAIRVPSAGGSVTINNSTLDSNRSAYRGGAINNFGTLTITNSSVTNNSTIRNGGKDGGAIYNRTQATIINSTLSGNSAGIAGGGAVHNFGTLTVEGSTISGNRAGSGAGINSSDALTITNSTVSRNIAATGGGGIYLAGWNNGTATVRSSTITGNAACDSTSGRSSAIASESCDGGGLKVASGATLTLDYSLVSGNIATGYGVELYSGGTTQGTLNLLGHSNLTLAEAVDGWTPPTGNILATQDFANLPLDNILDVFLKDNGGPTFTHALVSGSVAIDAIAPYAPGRAKSTQPTICTAAVSYDQRGIFRANGTTTGSLCDIGAFEYGLNPTAVTIVGFSAATVWGSGPKLSWETGSESGLSGFHIWRGSADAAETRLTDALIGASGGLNGSQYTWQDSASFGWGQRTYYWLEAVSADGSSRFTGPVEVWGLGKLFLPAIGR